MRPVLTKPDDVGAFEMSTDGEKQVLPVQFGRTSYGMLIFSLCQQEPALREQELEGTRSLARTCAGLLRHFELASLVFNGSPSSAVSLTRRQRDVLRLICQGCTLPAIVRQLQIARETAEKHRRQVYDVLRAKNDLEIRLNAYRAGLFSPYTLNYKLGLSPVRRIFPIRMCRSSYLFSMICKYYSMAQIRPRFSEQAARTACRNPSAHAGSTSSTRRKYSEVTGMFCCWRKRS